MRKLVKIVLGLAGVVVLLVIGLVVVLVLQLNSIARQGVEKGGTYALGVPTTLKDVDIGLLGGTMQLNALHVGNAPGFPSDHFLTLGEGKVAVQLSSLRGDVIRVPELTLSDIDVALEKMDGKANYDVIMGNLEKLTGGKPGEPAPPAPKEGQKKLIIGTLTIRNVNVHADLIGGPGAMGRATRVNVPIPEIRLTDVGQTGEGVAGSGVTISELAGLIVQAVMAAAVENGGLPAEFTADLRGHLANLGDMAGGLGKQVAAQATTAVQDLAKRAGPLGDDLGKKAGEELQKQADKLGEGLKGILPGKKDEKK
ncbi:MAG: hypothetical protein WD749_00215 [Phycisphaerales bacterium]